MQTKEIRIIVHEYSGLDELSETDRQLVLQAREAALKAYAPYSGFQVGAAVRLANEVVLSGNNQENAAYPTGLCAERTVLFYANANYPEVPVKTLAVTARNSTGLVHEPVKPCGGCRQALLEIEARFQQKIKVILDGEKAIWVLNGVESLLPFSFKPSALS